jgi:hypothetical protein
MQISYFGVEELAGQELRSPMERPTGTYSFVICIPPTPPDSSGTGGCPVSMHTKMGLLATPEGLAKFRGNPQWPWIVVQLTSRVETRDAVTREKLFLLCMDILMNIRRGALSLEPEFVEPPAFGLSEIVFIHPHQMAR